MLLYEGKAKKLFATDQPNVLRIEYKDDATAFNGQKKETIAGKGKLNNLFSSHFFELLKSEGIASHFIKKTSETEQLVQKVAIIPLEVIVRNTVAGTLAKRLGKPEGYHLRSPIVEFCYKNDALGDPLFNEEHIEALEIATKTEIVSLKEKALTINRILMPYFKNFDLDLIDFKLEFGKDDKQNILLADEISPDTCRLWDTNTKQKFDKDVFRRDLAPLAETYQQLAQKLGINL